MTSPIEEDERNDLKTQEGLSIKESLTRDFQCQCFFSWISCPRGTPVINIYSRIFLRIFEKIRNSPKGIILRARGTQIHGKNLKSKISCQTPINKTNSSIVCRSFHLFLIHCMMSHQPKTGTKCSKILTASGDEEHNCIQNQTSNIRDHYKMYPYRVRTYTILVSFS
jgi:hypothetical protein